MSYMVPCKDLQSIGDIIHFCVSCYLEWIYVAGSEWIILNWVEYQWCFIAHAWPVQEVKPKAIIAGITKNPVVQKKIIHFFIDNSNANISLHTLSCPKLKFGQFKAYKLSFALELSMKKWIKKIWTTGFLVTAAVEKCLRRNCISL